MDTLQAWKQYQHFQVAQRTTRRWPRSVNPFEYQNHSPLGYYRLVVTFLLSQAVLRKNKSSTHFSCGYLTRDWIVPYWIVRKEWRAYIPPRKCVFKSSRLYKTFYDTNVYCHETEPYFIIASNWFASESLIRSDVSWTFDLSTEMLCVCRKRLFASGLSNWHVDVADHRHLAI